MFKLYDVVKSKKEISEDIPIDTTGTVVMVYDEFTPIAYEVEFVNNEMETINVVTVEEEDIRSDSSDL
ncbi:hypothetical protein AWE51_19550 [Aquimarina aggregata]|uniref:DUF4926 domain-containing protein n=1 Tax=Aquimarina aggregata TaxID=1642818 RepID=A0A162WQ71_9FLAO|nr:DUF4926 domain-containing protein [Aquimarina aggregata]KZS38234.1 hypothetical protein AWE51_19550 [Aquimarina aggregata]